MVSLLCIKTPFVSSYPLEQRMKSFEEEPLLDPRKVLKKLEPEDDEKRMEAERAIEVIYLFVPHWPKNTRMSRQFL